MSAERPLTPKQEAFCREYAKGGNAKEAYRSAYDAENMNDGAVYVAASRLLDNAKISNRVHELTQDAVRRHNIDLDKLTDMAVSAYQKAEQSPFGADAMVKAVAQISKMHGFDAKERDNDRMPVGDVLAMIEARRKEREAGSDAVH